MIPEFLSGSYRRYKEDTTTFTTWLSQAAASVGHKLTPTTSTTPSPATPKPKTSSPPGVITAPSGRLKGAARKKAKAAASTAAPAAPPKAPDTVKYKVSTAGLLEQVTAVANAAGAGASARMPAPIRRVLERAIAARLRCTAWFETAHVEAQRSNRGHVHFIGVLQRALEALGGAKGEGEERDLNNRFAGLEVEDVDEELWAADVARKTREGKAEVWEVEVDKEWEDAFTVYCFFQDLHAIQDALKEAWGKYRDGKLDLVSATVVTNAGIRLAHRAEVDLLEANPQLNHWGPYTDVAMTVFYAETLRNGRDPREYLQSPESLEVRELEEFIYLPTARTLEKMARLSNMLPPETWPVPVPQMRFSYIVRPELLEDPKYQKLELEDEVLTELLHDASLTNFAKSFSGVGAAKVMPEAEDEFTKSLQIMWEKGTVNIHNVFASRVMLDIRDTCGELPIYFQSLLDMGKQAHSTFDFRNELDGSLSTGDARWLAKDNDLLLDTYQLITTHVPGTPLLELKRMMLQMHKQNPQPIYTSDNMAPEMEAAIRERDIAAGRDPDDGPTEEHKANAKRLNLHPIPPSEDLHSSLAGNPLLCGTLALNLHVSTEAAGLALANHHLSLFATAHLYNALRHLGLITLSWPALDRVITLHANPLFANDVPTTPATMHARLAYRIGASGSTRNFDKHQKWKMHPLPASVALRDYLAGRTGIEAVVARIEDALQEAHDGALVEKEGGQKKKSGQLRRRALTPLQFVHALQTYMPTVLPDMAVDYIGLTKTCNALMRAVRARIGEVLGVGYPVMATPGDSNDHGFLVMVLRVLDETRREEMVWSKRKEGKGKGEVFKGGMQLRVAGEAVEGFLGGRGGVRALA